MRILITGANGRLGRALQRTFSGEDVIALSHGDLDVTDRSAVEAFIARMTYEDDSAWPDVVIHAAALTDTTQCERDEPLALRVNELGTANVAFLADCTEHLFYISTNEVFDGVKLSPYQEDDCPNPLNAYGRSKYAGEVEAERESVGSLCSAIRTSWIYGGGGIDFTSKVLEAARGGKQLRFVTDEIATPTYVDDLAVAIRALIEQKAPGGIYHLTNEGEASRYEWACEILRLAGMSDVPVEPITTEELYASGYDGPRKPPYSVLANTRARALGITMRNWREALVDHFAKSRVAADA